MISMKDFYQKYWQWRKDVNYLYGRWAPPRLNIALEMILQDKENWKEEVNILDIGCGEGTFGKLLREQFQSNSVSLVALDMSIIAVDLARNHYDTLHVIDVENENLADTLKANFDYVICLETLEHVFNPESVLKKVKSVLKPKGFLITSSPNFAFYRNRLTVLVGEFPIEGQHIYSDVEHLHYFTWKSFSSMLLNAGFEIENVDADCGLLSKFIKTVPPIIRKKLFNIFGKQIVIKARQSG